MSVSRSLPTGVAAGRVDHAPKPGPRHAQLNAIIGHWITEGHIINADGSPGAKILASDVYEWAPGGFFVLHSAYGFIGDVGAGGVEMIGYVASDAYRIHFFDSLGNVTRHELTIRNHTWIWQGEFTRCTSVFSEDYRTQTAHHERTDDGANWVASMHVVLRKV